MTSPSNEESIMDKMKKVEAGTLEATTELQKELFAWFSAQSSVKRGNTAVTSATISLNGPQEVTVTNKYDATRTKSNTRALPATVTNENGSTLSAVTTSDSQVTVTVTNEDGATTAMSNAPGSQVTITKGNDPAFTAANTAGEDTTVANTAALHDFGFTRSVEAWRERYLNYSARPIAEQQRVMIAARTANYDNAGDSQMISIDTIDIDPVLRQNMHSINITEISPAQRMVFNQCQRHLRKNGAMFCGPIGLGMTFASIMEVSNMLVVSRHRALHFDATAIPVATAQVPSKPLVLFIATTREGALDIFTHVNMLVRGTSIQAKAIYGGTPVDQMMNNLAGGCDLLSATLGRLNHFLNKGCIDLSSVQRVVFDNADVLLPGSFKEIQWLMMHIENVDPRPKLIFLMSYINFELKTLIGSLVDNSYSLATLGSQCREALKYDDVWISFSDDDEKLQKLKSLLADEDRFDPWGQVIIFVDKTSNCEALVHELTHGENPINADDVQTMCSLLSQQQREQNMMALLEGTVRVTVATHIISRQHTFKQCNQVILYDRCPSYMVREQASGIVGRRGLTGKVFHFVNDTDKDNAQDYIERYSSANSNRTVENSSVIWPKTDGVGQIVELDREDDTDAANRSTYNSDNIGAEFNASNTPRHNTTATDHNNGAGSHFHDSRVQPDPRAADYGSHDYGHASNSFDSAWGNPDIQNRRGASVSFDNGRGNPDHHDRYRSNRRGNCNGGDVSSSRNARGTHNRGSRGNRGNFGNDSHRSSRGNRGNLGSDSHRSSRGNRGNLGNTSHSSNRGNRRGDGRGSSNGIVASVVKVRWEYYARY